jgi:hypothetical protein
VEDLCALGWHVCASAKEVAALVSTCALDSANQDAVWITRQTMSEPVDGGVTCVPTGTNNIAGCGDIGLTPACPPLNRALFTGACGTHSPWYCGGDTDGTVEATLVIKTGPERGGVLCCKDGSS